MLLLFIIVALLTLLINARRCPRRALLAVAHQRQDAYLCVPTCASMVLTNYGEIRTPVELKQLAVSADPHFDGTYFHDMVAGVGKLGYPWREATFALTDAGWERGIRRLKREIAAGRPVIVGVFHPPIGHAVVLAGYDDQGCVIVVDRSLTRQERR